MFVRRSFIALAGTIITQFLLLPCVESSETHKELHVFREIRSLSGELDKTAVFNSNSPEIVRNDGILLSTFPHRSGSSNTEYELDRNFRVFIHHVASKDRNHTRGDLYLGLLVGNTQEKPVEVEVVNAASYLTHPDAPFISLPSLIENNEGTTFAGPGDRVTTDLLLNRRGLRWQKSARVPPGKKLLLCKFAIPVQDLGSQLNARTYMAQLQSDGPVRLALVASFARSRRRLLRYLLVLAVLPPHITRYASPTEQDFIRILDEGNLVEPREQRPLRSEDAHEIRYGRVSGISIGAVWHATLTDKEASHLSLPPPEKPISYALDTLKGATFGTEQIQSAPLAVRNDDTAYEADGNYGVKYDLALPLKNPYSRDLKLYLSLETPMKSEVKSNKVPFVEPPYGQIFFRGTIKITVKSNNGTDSISYFHLVQHYGESGSPFLTLPFAPGQEESVHIEFFYPPDCTPPHLLTLSTVE